MPAAAKTHWLLSVLGAGVLPRMLVGSQELKEMFGGVHSSRAVYFGSRRKKLGVTCLVSWRCQGSGLPHALG